MSNLEEFKEWLLSAEFGEVILDLLESNTMMDFDGTEDLDKETFIYILQSRLFELIRQKSGYESKIT